MTNGIGAETVDEAYPAAMRVRWVIVLLAVLLLALVAVFGVLRIYRGMNEAREAARRSMSRGYLKKMGISLLEYHEKYGTLPTRGDAAEGPPNLGGHSWQAAILPYVEQGSLYRGIAFEEPWQAARNRTAFQTEVPYFVQPNLSEQNSLTATGYARSDYAGNVHLLGLKTKFRLSEVPSGTAGLLLVGEVDTEPKAWGDPDNLRDAALGFAPAPDRFHSRFGTGPQFVFTDGSVRAMSRNTDVRILKALAIPSVGETEESVEGSSTGLESEPARGLK